MSKIQSTNNPLIKGRFDLFMLLLILVIIGLLPLVGPLGGLHWHDQQRIGQVLVFTLTLLPLGLAFFGHGTKSVIVLPELVNKLLFAILILGLCSSLRAAYPLWSLVEISLYVGCVTLGWFFAQSREKIGKEHFDRLLLAFIFFFCSAMILQYLVAYVSLLTSGDKVIYVKALLSGFSNIRFYGHVSTLTLPLLVVPLLVKGNNPKVRLITFAGLVVWWSIAIAGGTRGTWLSMACAVVFMSCISRLGRRWAIWQIAGALAGFALFYFMMSWIPSKFGHPVYNHAAERLTTTLNGRDQMWLRALAIIKAHPLLGAGPMHYAHSVPPNFAGPHQAVLLWASEWGLPATACILVVTYMAAMRILREIRRQSLSLSNADVLYFCLATSLFSAGVQAMVCRVVTMPYTHLWLTIVGGYLFALDGVKSTHRTAGSRWLKVWSVVSFIAVLFLTGTVSLQAPQLNFRLDAYVQCFKSQKGLFLSPRFWVQGLIGVDEKNSKFMIKEESLFLN